MALTSHVAKLTADGDMLKAQQPIILQQHAHIYCSVTTAGNEQMRHNDALGKLNATW